MDVLRRLDSIAREYQALAVCAVENLYEDLGGDGSFDLKSVKTDLGEVGIDAEALFSGKREFALSLPINFQLGGLTASLPEDLRDLSFAARPDNIQHPPDDNEKTMETGNNGAGAEQRDKSRSSTSNAPRKPRPKVTMTSAGFVVPEAIRESWSKTFPSVDINREAAKAPRLVSGQSPPRTEKGIRPLPECLAVENGTE